MLTKRLRIFVSLKGSFPNATTFTVINKYSKCGAIQIEQCFDPLAFLLSKGPLKHDFLDIYLTIIFGAGKSGNTSATRIILILKMFKI